MQLVNYGWEGFKQGSTDQKAYSNMKARSRDNIRNAYVKMLQVASANPYAKEAQQIYRAAHRMIPGGDIIRYGNNGEKWMDNPNVLSMQQPPSNSTNWDGWIKVDRQPSQPPVPVAQQSAPVTNSTNTINPYVNQPVQANQWNKSVFNPYSYIGYKPSPAQLVYQNPYKQVNPLFYK